MHLPFHFTVPSWTPKVLIGLLAAGVSKVVFSLYLQKEPETRVTPQTEALKYFSAAEDIFVTLQTYRSRSPDAEKCYVRALENMDRFLRLEYVLSHYPQTAEPHDKPHAKKLLIKVITNAYGMAASTGDTMAIIELKPVLRELVTFLRKHMARIDALLQPGV